MNHIYSVLWNSALGRFCVTSELGRSRSRATTRRSGRRDASRHSALAALATGVALAWSAPAWSQATLPQGGQVVAGIASIGQSGRQMTVQQSSDKAIVNWQSFNIGANHQVTFQQPSHTAVALNRVIGADPTAIHGSLQANGRVFLVNPNGMLFGAGANVNVGGLVASTLNIADKDFLQGHYRFSGQGSGTQGAALRNAGRITVAEGGAVALLGGSVSNQGTIAARRGTVALAAGNQVKLDFAGDGLLNVQVQQSSLNALVENHQLIEADGGSVLMTAKATDALLQTVVNNTGTVRARTVENRAGKIVLLGGFDGGTTQVAGTLDASAPDGGDGGFVDTSGAHVQIEAGTRVTTRAAQGKTGTWLIDPTDFTIGAGAGPRTASGIGADTLTANLATTGVSLQTLDAGSEAGDIHVNAAVSWDKNVLTLNAHRNININAVMSVNGDGTLALNYGGTQGNAMATPAAGSNLNVNAGGRIDFEKHGLGRLTVNGHDFKVIHTLDDLSGIHQGLNGKYALGRNIDASPTAATAQGFAPIGAATTPFTGVFDGLGHSINQLTINRPSADGVGLFGYANNAVLRNIGLVRGSTVGQLNTGALVGNQLGGSISNAYATGSVTGFDLTGGLVGANTGSISNAYATGNVTGKYTTGGLVGYQSNTGSISNAYVTGSVTGDEFTGGLVGIQSRAGISNAYAAGNVTGNYSTGGLVGFQSYAGSISNAYATGSITGDDSTGGLVGIQNSGGSISNAYAVGSVTGRVRTGGLVGHQYGNISNAYATGRVSGSEDVGGLVGNHMSGSIINAYWNTETTGQVTSAGFGSGGGTGLTTAQIFDTAQWTGFEFGTVWGNANGQTTPYLLNMAGNQVFNRNDLPTGNITASNRPALYTALLDVKQLQAVQNNLSGRYLLGNDIDASATAGWNNGAGFASIGSQTNAFTGVFDGLGHTINNLTIYRPAQDYVGLVGYSRNATLRNVRLDGGKVTGRSYVGMLAGRNHAAYGSALISNVYATGEVEAKGDYAGGLVGHNLAEFGTASISNASAKGGVSATSYAGGLVGANTAEQRYDSSSKSGESQALISHAYATGQVSARNQYAGGLAGVNSTYIKLKGVYLLGLGTTLGTAGISNAYATGQVIAKYYAGGLVGANKAEFDSESRLATAGSKPEFKSTATISNAYATGQVKALADNAGGLAGANLVIGTNYEPNFVWTGTASISKVYASGQVSALGNVGGVVGWNHHDDLGDARVADAYATGHTSAISAGNGYNAKVKTLNSEQLKQQASFSGWSMSGEGGSNTVWRIYEGDTAPLLRSFLTEITVSNSATPEHPTTREYDGTNVFTVAHDHAEDSLVLGELRYTVSGKNVGTHYAEGPASGLYSSQQGYDIIYAPSEGRYVIEQKKISGTITAQNKEYDRSEAATIHQTSLSGVIAGENVTIDSGSGRFEDWNAGTGKQVTATGLSGQDAANYQLTATSTTADITPRSVIGKISAKDKTYDSKTDATIEKVELTGILDGDSVDIDLNSGKFADKNAGTAKRVYADALIGDHASNYTLDASQTATKADITKAKIYAVTGISAQNRDYDSTEKVALNQQNALFNGKFDGDALSVANASGKMDDKHAGKEKAVAITGITLGGVDKDNYELVDSTASTTVDIAKAKIHAVTGISAQNRDYDSTEKVALNPQNAMFTGKFDGDALSVANASGKMDDKRAGKDKAVSITGITLGGADKDNYELVDSTATTKVDIAKAKIAAVTGITAQNRDYDSMEQVALNPQNAMFTGMFGGDTLSVSNASGKMDDKHVDKDKAVSITGITLGGADKDNYELVDSTATTKVDIAKAKISAVTGITAQNRDYDSTEQVVLNQQNALFNGKFDGDALSVSNVSGKMDDKHAGKDKAVSITGITLGGADKNNYELVDSTATTKVDIAKAKIAAVTGITAENRDYDSTEQVALKPQNAFFTGKFGGDTLSVATASGKMDDKHAGKDKAVSITGITLGGDDKGNYELVDSTATTKVDIAKAKIASVTGITAQNRDYDSTEQVTLNQQNALFIGKFDGDALSVANASGKMEDKHAGKDKAVNITGITLGGDDRDNYELVRTNASTKVDIAKALIDQVTGITAENRTYNGGLGVNLLTNGAQFEGRLGNDQLSVATASGAMDSKNAGDGKVVGITGITLGGDDKNNYELVRTTASTKVDIAKALIDEVTGITAENRTYNGGLAVNLLTNAAQFEGRLGNDQLTVATATGAMDTKNAGDGKAVGITGITLGGDDRDNYELVRTTASTKVDIAKALIDEVTGITAENRTYNGGLAVNLLTNAAQFEGRLGNDQLTVATVSGAMDTKNAGDSKPVDITGITLGGIDAGNYTLVKTTAATKAHIDQRAIKAVITADDKTYDATMAAVTHGRLDALLGEDHVTLATNGIFATKDAGKDKTVNVSGSLAGTDAGNYRLEHNETAKADIAQHAINAVITADGKSYDATMGAVTQGQLGALLGEDRVTLATSGIFATKDAGKDKTVNVSGTLSGADAGNYRLEHNQIAKADITQRAINAVISADGKIYDATRTAITQGQLGALLGEDQVTLTTSGSFVTKDAGKDKTVNVSGSLAGNDAGNYRLEHNQTAKADIAQRAINAVISADGKIYDATEAAVTHGQLAALLGEDQVTLTTNGSFATKDAGTGKTVNVSGSLAGSDAGNYRLEHNQTAKADIAQRAIDAVISADGKVYDATEAAVTHGQLAALLGDDQVTLTTSGSFATKDAGKDKTVNVSGTLTGTDAGNYRLEHNQTAKADIDPRAINAVITANGKTYDATRTAVTHGQLGTLLGEDQVTLATSGIFATKDAGKDKTVNVSAALSGNDAGNYRLVHNATAQADIDQLTIEVLIGASNKTYDATTAATTRGTLGNSILGTDQVALATRGQFADKSVGTDKTVSVSGTLSGADAGNYRLVHNETTMADIARLAIQGAITAENKTYDGLMDATTHGDLGNAVLGQDQVTLITTGRFDSRNAGENKAVALTAELKGADAGNYLLVHNDSTSADIDARAINAVITANGKTYDATRTAMTQGQLGDRIGEDQLTLATSGSFATKDAGSGKTVNVTGTLSGADAGNYRLVHNATAQADIDQLTIEVLIGASNKTYDATTAATTRGSLGNAILGSDQVALATRGQFADKSAATDKTVSVSGTLSGTDAGNYRLVHNETTMADIARLTIQGTITAENKTYDGLMGATTHGDLGNAVLGQDQVTLVTTGRFDSRNAGENKAVALTAELKGADAGNYLLVHNDSTSADIDPRAINAVITANGKTYDATRTAMTQGQLGDRIGEDQLTLATSGSFATKDASTGKTVNVTGTLSGADAGNYRLVHNVTAQADISQLAIHASIAADDKDYDGGIAATTRGALTGVLAGDSVALRTRGSFLDPAAGSAKLVRVGATLDGEDAGNYRLEHNASTWAAIRPEATVTAAVLTDVHAGAHPSRIEVARPEASASLSACLGDVYPLPAQVMNLGGLAVADAQQQRQPAIVFARVGGSVSDRACARTPF